MKNKLHSKAVPHDGVYTRLGKSIIHGVGVFAIIDVPKGTYPFSDDDEPIVWVDKSTVETLSVAIRQLYYSFAIIKGGQIWLPNKL
jgi:hypothetical protein